MHSQCHTTYLLPHGRADASGVYLQKIVHSAEVATQVTEELSKFGSADFDTVSRLAEEFLTNVKVRLSVSMHPHAMASCVCRRGVSLIFIRCGSSRTRRQSCRT